MPDVSEAIEGLLDSLDLNRFPSLARIVE